MIICVKEMHATDIRELVHHYLVSHQASSLYMSLSFDSEGSAAGCVCVFLQLVKKQLERERKNDCSIFRPQAGRKKR